MDGQSILSRDTKDSELNSKTCLVCGRRPDSVYVRLDDQSGQSSFSLGLFRVDTNRLLKDHPDAVGVVCLSCLLAYRQQEGSDSPLIQRS